MGKLKAVRVGGTVVRAGRESAWSLLPRATTNTSDLASLFLESRTIQRLLSSEPVEVVGALTMAETRDMAIMVRGLPR